MHIELTEQKSEMSIVIKKRTNMQNLKTVIDKGYVAIYSYITELGKHPSGAPYIAYFGMPEAFSMLEEFDIEMGFPIDSEIPEKGELYMSNIYEGRIVTGTHQGSYQGLEKAYDEIFKYIEENNLQPVKVYYEYYINDPSITSEDELLTKIVVPVK